MDYDILKTIKDNPGIAVMLAWELGKSYQLLYEMLDLGNVINFNDVEFANSRGAQWKLDSGMEDFIFYTMEELEEFVNANWMKEGE